MNVFIYIYIYIEKCHSWKSRMEDFRVKVGASKCFSLTPHEQYFSYVIAVTSYIRRDDNDIRLVLD